MPCTTPYALPCPVQYNAVHAPHVRWCNGICIRIGIDHVRARKVIFDGVRTTGGRTLRAHLSTRPPLVSEAKAKRVPSIKPSRSAEAVRETGISVQVDAREWTAQICTISLLRSIARTSLRLVNGTRKSLVPLAPTTERRTERCTRVRCSG